MIYTWEFNFVLLLSNFIANISTTNIDKAVSMLFSTLKQHWVINIELT